MTILRTVSLVLASTLIMASAASAQHGQRDGRRGEGRDTHVDRQVPHARPSVIVRSTPPPVVYETRRPYGYWWKRHHDYRDFRGRHQDRRWYRWW